MCNNAKQYYNLSEYLKIKIYIQNLAFFDMVCYDLVFDTLRIK